MNFLKNQVFYAHNEEPFTIVDINNNGEEESREATTSEVLLLVCKNYNPAQDEILSFDQIRHLNKFQDCLEDDPDEDDYYHIKHEWTKTIELVIKWTVPKMGPAIRRQADGILHLITETPEEKPKDTEIPENISAISGD